jgi:hypothetical protein
VKIRDVLLGGLLASSSIFAADPFVGKWVLNQKKSPPPTINYGIKDLGDNRYALTGSAGQTTKIKADGVTIDSPFGGTVSFKKMNDGTWQMIRDSPGHLVRIYATSPDGKTLKITDHYTSAAGGSQQTEVAYRRMDAAGKGIVGEWQSVSATVSSQGAIGDLAIEPYGKDGMSFIWPSSKARLDLNFDGKSYVVQGPGVQKGSSTRGTRVSDHLLKLEDLVDGKIDETEELTLSDDGKVLTLKDKPVNSATVFTNVYDRH